MRKVLLHGASLTRQIIEPFAAQIKAACEDVEFISAGLFLSKGMVVVNDNPVFEMEKCYSYSFQRNVEMLNFDRLGPRRIVAEKIERRLAGLGAPGRFKKLMPEIDLFHCHGLFAPAFSLRIVASCPRMPLVVSCWGSDVLRTHDPTIIGKQQKLLQRAQAITVCSPEFREIVLAKFGQSLRSKVVLTQFSANLEGVLQSERAVSGSAFKAARNISDELVTVGIAHNGHKDNQHLDILASLSALNQETLNRLHLVIPMTYGAEESYLTKVNLALEALGIKFTLLTSFLSDEDVVSLRNAIDIFIYAPVSDAYSSSVSQALAAGSECILGSWLPYKSRVSAGFQYTEIDSPSEAGTALELVLRKHLHNVERSALNRRLAKSFFEPVRLGLQWRSAYQLAFDSQRCIEGA